MPRYSLDQSTSIFGLDMLSVGTMNSYAQPRPCNSLLTHLMLRFLQYPVIGV